MSAIFWYFESVPSCTELLTFSGRKQTIRSAVVGLQTITSFRVLFVYPSPWSLSGAHLSDILIQWTNYYTEALLLKEDFPDRVSFQSLEDFLLQSGVNPPPSAQQAIDQSKSGLDVDKLSHLLNALRVNSVKSSSTGIPDSAPDQGIQANAGVGVALGGSAESSPALGLETAVSVAQAEGFHLDDVVGIQTEIKLLRKQIWFLKQELEFYFTEVSRLHTELEDTKRTIIGGVQTRAK